MKDKEGIVKQSTKTGEARPAPGLYIVATPIGNLEDLSFRALRILKEADWVAAEDTRESRKLLDHYGVSAQLHSLHEHSTKSRIDELVQSLHGGKVGAYVSDAGTPALCDPGSDLVKACVDQGIPVYAVPGASAPLTLLSICGFKEPEFSFHGFFARENKDREAWAKTVESVGGPQLFFESPHRIVSTLEFLKKRFPETELVVGRELTKKFETVSRGTCQSVAEVLVREEPRGEYVLALRLPKSDGGSSGLKPEAIVELVKELALLGVGQKVLLRVAMSHGMKKNEAYKLALEILEK